MSLSLFRQQQPWFDPFEAMTSPFSGNDFGDLITSMDRPSRSMSRTSAAGGPLCSSLIEKPSEFLLRMDVPGVEKKDVAVNVDNGRLYVAIERTDQTSQDDEYIQFSEYRFGKSSRSFPLPRTVDESAIKAEHSDEGVLTITLPKYDRETKEKIEAEQSGTTISIA
eukprot:403488_1